ncbi:type VI secretion system Hcp family effector [Paraburkholderia sp. GAS448]|uniref:type VI secretion system tube protein Hcp n=1 Tax=Paraburkholderia sp. GAS448 TaxID=3035136 RepID=UPI003D19C6FC
MASPLHLWLKVADGTPIRASSEVLGREGSIEVLSIAHGMHAPTDGHTGMLTGSRIHHPLSIEKDIDKSTPILYRAIARSETFSEAVLRWSTHDRFLHLHAQ